MIHKIVFLQGGDGKQRQIMVKRISPSPSPSPTSVATPMPASSSIAISSGITSLPTTTTRLIQISGSNTATRFVRPIVSQQPQVLIRGPVRTTSTPIALPTQPVSMAGTSGAPLIVRAATPANPGQPQQLVWPSQPLATSQLQGMFQRPRPPPPPAQPQQVRLQGSPAVVRTILIPRSGQQTVLVQQPQVNTPLPSIQLPSEPVPISPQVMFTIFTQIIEFCKIYVRILKYLFIPGN